MKKFAAFSALALLVVAGPGWCQFYARPTTNPYVRPGLYSTYNRWSYTGPALGGPYSFYSPYALRGYAGGMPTTGPSTSAPGYSGPGGMSVTGVVGDTGRTAGRMGPGGNAVDPNSPNITGHPTTFFNYSHYFFNRGGATTQVGGVPSAVTAPITPFTGAGILGRGSSTDFGKAPARSRSGTRPNR